jgi:hypothetical protein
MASTPGGRFVPEPEPEPVVAAAVVVVVARHSEIDGETVETNSGKILVAKFRQWLVVLIEDKIMKWRKTNWFLA